MALTSIGRFKVGSRLGSGRQGTVYLCGDPELQRRVAIKLLDRTMAGSAEVDAAFYAEARSMSKIQHPNIVSIYEAGKHQGVPYLVFEYVEGQLLSQLIASGELELPAALDLFQSVLEGMDCAHEKGIVHCDLKPANIMINRERVPKIMDFGIARVLSENAKADPGAIGSLHYLAPEYLEHGRSGTQSDVFALGLILGELLTGRPVVSDRDRRSVADSVLRQPVQPPSAFNAEVDERLDQLVLKALDKDPDARYPAARDMLAALQAYRDSRLGRLDVDPRDENGTVDFLLRRMQRQNDFPALSRSIRVLNGIAASSDKDVNAMAKVIVQDYALTSKLLKVVNSAFYGHFAGKIGTISRAVVILGMQPIRALAASLIFFEHLHNKAQADALRAQVSAALFSAVLAAQAAAKTGEEQVEEHFLCAMLHQLGKVLVTFYLHEEGCEIERLIERESLPSEHAERRVLGTTLEQVGMRIARHWNFPLSIRHSMQQLPPGEAVRAPKTREESLHVVACFANEAAELVAQGALDDPQAVRNLLRRYDSALDLHPAQFRDLAAAATAEFQELSRDPAGSPREDKFIRQLNSAQRSRVASQSGAAADDTAGGRQSTGAADDSLEEGLLRATPPAASDDAEDLLTSGLQEVTNLLVGTQDLNQVLNVVLETTYRALACQCVLFCLRNPTTREMTARTGFGQNVELLIQRFRFCTDYEPDIFHAVLKNGVDAYIADTAKQNIRKDLPSWYTEISNAGCFLVFPVLVGKRPLGLIYADHPQPEGLRIAGKTLNLLKALRNQLVLAFRGQG